MLYSEYLFATLRFETEFRMLIRTELMEILICGHDRAKEEYNTDYHDAYNECENWHLSNELTYDRIRQTALKYRVSVFLLVHDCETAMNISGRPPYANVE